MEMKGTPMKANLSSTWPLLALTFALLIPADVMAYYDPGVQRWINRDPIADESSLAQVTMDPPSDAMDALSMAGNPYSFGKNGPVDHLDPDGRTAITIAIGGGVIAVGTGICYLVPSCRDAMVRATKDLLQWLAGQLTDCKTGSPWVSGPKCKQWLNAPTVATCTACCEEQMGFRQGRGIGGQSMLDSLLHCKRTCGESSGLHGPTIHKVIIN
jgi:hypothetical protein